MAKALGGHLEMLLAVRGGGGRCAHCMRVLTQVGGRMTSRRGEGASANSHKGTL